MSSHPFLGGFCILVLELLLRYFQPVSLTWLTTSCRRFLHVGTGLLRVCGLCKASLCITALLILSHLPNKQLFSIAGVPLSKDLNILRYSSAEIGISPAAHLCFASKQVTFVTAAEMSLIDCIGIEVDSPLFIIFISPPQYAAVLLIEWGSSGGSSPRCKRTVTPQNPKLSTSSNNILFPPARQTLHRYLVSVSPALHPYFSLRFSNCRESQGETNLVLFLEANMLLNIVLFKLKKLFKNITQICLKAEYL